MAETAPVQPSSLTDPLERLAAQFGAGQTVLNGWLHLPGGVSAEVMGRAGYDSLTIDLQHGLIGDGGLVASLQAIAATGAAPLVRVPWLHPPDLMRALDAGAGGIICPMIETAEQAQALVHACRYPPQGGRSYGPTRAALLYPDYLARAQTRILVFAMVETRLGLTNLEAILDTPGLSGIYVGPGDLRLSLTGQAGLDFTQAPVSAAVDLIARETRRRGKVAGIFTQGGALAREAMSRGYQLVTAGSDLALLGAAARETVRALRGQEQTGPTPALTPSGY